MQFLSKNPYAFPIGAVLASIIRARGIREESGIGLGDRHQSRQQLTLLPHLFGGIKPEAPPKSRPV